MKTVYLIYASIPELIFNKVKYLMGTSGNYFKWKNHNMYGLYAWSDDIKLVKEFTDLRYQEIYNIVKKKFEPDEFKRFKKAHKLDKLGLYKFKINNNEKIDIVCTNNEHYVSTEEYESYMPEFGTIVYKEVPFSIFNDKIINALDILGYVANYTRTYSDDEEYDAIISCIDHNESYGLTYFGNKIAIDFHNEVGNFVLLYKFFLIGQFRGLE